MPTQTEILAQLQAFCADNGLSSSHKPLDPDLDLIQSGAVDSMALATLQAWIEQRYDLYIAPEIFLMELRTLAAIARYVAQEQPE